MGQQGFPILAAALADPSPRRVIEKNFTTRLRSGRTDAAARTNKQTNMARLFQHGSRRCDWRFRQMMIDGNKSI
jgi:hypothetical protein